MRVVQTMRWLKPFPIVVLVTSGLLLLAWLFPDQVRKLTDPRIAAAKSYQARYAALRQRLRALAAKLPGEVDEMRPSPPLDPPVNYSTFGPVDARNTDGLMYEQLLDPDVEGVKPFGVQISTFLAEALRSSGPRPPLHGSREFDDPARLAAALERGLQLRYLAVSRVLRHDPIVLLSYGTFTRGTAEISGVLVDLQTDAVRCAFRVRADTPTRFHTSGKDLEAQDASLQERARLALCDSGRSAFLTAMLNVCGGHVRSDAVSTWDHPCG
jgi:hypothetical protein